MSLSTKSSLWIWSKPFSLEQIKVKETINAYLLSDINHQWLIWVAKKMIKTEANQSPWLFNKNFKYQIFQNQLDQNGWMQKSNQQECDYLQIEQIFLQPLDEK